MKKRWIALGVGAAVAVGLALLQGPRLPALAPPVTIHSGAGAQRLTLSQDGRILADRSRSGQVLLYDTATGQQSCAFPVPAGWVAFSPDARHLLTQNTRATPASPDGTVYVWDTATGAQVSRFVPPTSPGATPYIAALSRDLRLAVVRGIADYRVYDVTAGRLVNTLPLALGKSQAAFSPDGGLLAIKGGAVGTLQVWDTKTWQRIRAMGSPVPGVTGIRFSQDGSRIAIGSTAGLAWWDTHSWKPLGRFALPSPQGLPRGCFYFSSDGRSLLVNPADASETLHQVDCATGHETLTEPNQSLHHVSLTGDRAESWVSPGKYQLLFYRDTYCIWNTALKKQIYQITVPPAAGSPLMGDFQVHSEDLSADGHVFAAGGYDDGVIRVWRLP